MKMDQLLVDYCYQRRAIRTYDWMRILQSIALEYKYYIYRRSYWGENSGCSIASTSKTSSCAFVTIIDGVPINDLDTEPADGDDDNESTCLVKRPAKTIKARKYLLIEDNHIKTMDVRLFRYVGWTNERYVLDHTEDVIC